MRFPHLVCWIHLLSHLSGVAPGANAQDEEESAIQGDIYDFATSMQLPGVEAIESVIESDFYIRGPIEIRQLPILAEAVRSAVARVCQLEGDRPAPVLAERPVLDIATMLEVNKGFQMKFYIMPPFAGGRLCMDSLLMSAFGGKEPPFDEDSNPEPPIRSLLYWEFIASGELASLAEDLDLWFVNFQNFTCDYEDALAPPMVNRSINPLGGTTTLPPLGVSTTKWPDACMDGLDVPFWDPSFAKNIKDASTSCSLAGSPCMCGAIPGCYWGYQSAGGYRCQDGPGGVSCRACPKQQKCPVDSPEVCPTLFEPCACARAVAPCVWDKAESRCRVRAKAWEFTACDDCSRQPSCPGPDVTTIEPDNLMVMGAPEVGWLINVTWNRQIKFGVGDLKAELACRAGGGGDEVTYRFTEERMMLMHMNNGTVMTLDVKGLRNERMRDCDVVFGEALVMDQWFKPNSLIAGLRTVTIEDLVSPEIQTFDPPNSPNPVNVTPTTVTLVFTESVQPSSEHPTPIIKLWQMGGSWTGGGSGADVVVKEYDVRQDPEVPNEAVKFEGNRMTVQLGLVILPDRMYSISLAEGVILDYAWNPLPALELGGYAFRVGSELGVGDPDNAPLIPPDVLRYGAMGISGAAILSALVWGFGRVQCLRPKSLPWDGKDTSAASALEVTSRYGQEIDNLDLFKGASAVSTLADTQMSSFSHTAHGPGDLVDPESGSTPMSALRVKITNAWVEQSLRATGHTTGSPRHAFHGSSPHHTWGNSSPRRNSFSGDSSGDDGMSPMRRTAMGRLQVTDYDSDFSPISRKDRRIPSDQSFLSYVDARSPASTVYTQHVGTRRRSFSGEPGTADCRELALVLGGKSMARSPSPKLPGSVRRDPSSSSRRTGSSPGHWHGRTSSRKSSGLSQATADTMSIREFGECDLEGQPSHGRWRGRTTSRKTSGLSQATAQSICEFGEDDLEDSPSPPHARWHGRTTSRKTSGLSQATEQSIREFGEDDLEDSPEHPPVHGSRRPSIVAPPSRRPSIAAPPPYDDRVEALGLTANSWARATSHSLVSCMSPPRSPAASPTHRSPGGGRKSRASPRPQRTNATPRHGGMLW